MKKDQKITIRISKEELEEIQRIADYIDVPYQNIIRCGGLLYAKKREEEHKKFVENEIKSYKKNKNKD